MHLWLPNVVEPRAATGLERTKNDNEAHVETWRWFKLSRTQHSNPPSKFQKFIKNF